MRFSAAVVLLALSATPASHAFVPLSFGVVKHGSKSKQRQHEQAQHQSSTSTSRHVSLSDISNVMVHSDGDDDRNNKALYEDPFEEELSKLAAIEARATTAAYMAQYENQSGASIIYSKLMEHGVTVVNGFSGGAVLPLLDQFHEEHPRHATSGKKPIRWITNSNESSAGHIAEGYAKSMPILSDAQIHKPVGVAIATSGPGVTNLITPLQDAICDGVPMVVLCGQAATTAPADAFQFAPAVEMTTPCTKWSYKIKSAAELPLVMDYAFFVARNGRPGPVFVDLPKDLQNQILTSEMIDRFIDAENPGDEKSFARLVKKRRPEGDDNKGIFQALQLGSEGQGLAFEVYKDEVADFYKLKPVTTGDAEDLHHADHHPANKIYHNVAPDGDEIDANVALEYATEQDDLAVGSVLTTRIVSLIQRAKKPVIIAGQGCNDSKEELTAFAEKLNIPVTTTLHAMGCFDERNPLALNMMGMHGHPTPNFLVQEADLIINVGSRFDDRITGRMGDFVPAARKAAEERRGGVIHVDIRITEKNKQLKPTFFVHSTGKHFLQTMNAALDSFPVNHQRTAPWLARMRELQEEFPVKVPHFRTEKVETTDEDGNLVTLSRTPMSAQSVITELNRQLVKSGKIDETIFTTGVGIHQMVAAQLITWTQPRQMLSSGSLGTMGVALGYCIGAKLANGGKICIAIDGDGSFNMTFTELKTVAEQKIPIKIMIVDNDGQMMVEYWQRLFHDNRLIAVRNSANPDYSMLAKSFGIKSVHCDHSEDLEAKMKEFLFADPGEPVLFHVQVKRTPCLPLVAPGQPLDDMILEDVEVDVDQSAAPS